MARSLALAALVTLLAAPLLAGCVAPSSPLASAIADAPPAAPLDWAVRALPNGGGHNHRDPAQHQALSTSNFQVIGREPGATSHYNGATAGGYFCGGIANDGARKLAVVSSFTTDIAFILVDVTDPAAPAKVGEYALRNVFTYDADITPDGKHVVIAAEPELLSTNQPPALGRTQIVFRDACGNEVAGPEQDLPIAPGIILVDVQDPTNPTFADFWPTPALGPHSVSTAEVDGTVYATASTTNLVHHVGTFDFFQIVETPAASRLVHLSTVDAGLVGATSLMDGHLDVAIAKHPVTGQTLAYLANWDGGMVVLDMTVPFAPLEIARWRDNNIMAGSYGSVHSARPIDGLWDGKHYLVVGQEFGGRPAGRPTGWIYLLDITDPEAPKEVSRWTLPHDPGFWNGFMFSTHYFDIVDRTIFVAMYHGGVWAIDVHDVTNPTAVGVFIPADVAPKPPRVRGIVAGLPFVLDVLALETGELVVFESSSGAYVVRFDEAAPAPALSPWHVPGS